MTTSSAFRKIQIGRESSPHGSAVAATRIIFGELAATPSPTYHQPDNESRFSLAGRHQREVTSQLTTLSYSGAANFKSLHHILGMTLRGNRTPTEQTVGEGDYQWEFIFRTNDSNAPDTYSWQYGNSVQAYRVANAFPTSLSIAYTMAEAVQLSLDLSGNEIELNTFTSLSPIDRQIVLGSKLKVFIDDSLANLGTTEFPGQIVSATLEPELGLEVARYAKGSLNPSAYGETVRVGTLQLVMAFDSNAKAELDKFLDGSDRFIRLSVDSGVQIGAGQNYKLDIDCRVKWTEGPELFGEEFGQNTIPLSGELYPFEPTGEDPRLLTATLINDVSSLSD